MTTVNGINDLGDIVGSYENPDFTFHGFLLSGGQFTTIDFPGIPTRFFGGPFSINNARKIVGSTGGGNGAAPVNYLWQAGQFSVVSLPQSAQDCTAFAINNFDWLAGLCVSGSPLEINEAFLASLPALVDPITGDPSTSLLSGAAVRALSSSADAHALATGGRPVQGVAADGVTEVVVRIPANNVGDQFTLTVINDASPPAQSSLPNEDGALGNPGDTSFSLSQLTVTAVDSSTDPSNPAPFAFAVYRAPLDFGRENSDGSFKSGVCNGVGKTDDNLACRSVSIQIQDLAQNTTSTLPIVILRPPVVMVHGLWDNWKTWNNFNPLVQGPNNVDKRFSIGRVSYDAPIGPLIVDSDPPYHAIVSAFAESNSLGFAFNAVLVQQQTDGWIENFREGNNPVGIPAAAVQADIVAHSMGGVIARTMALQTTFLGNSTYGQGTIHKLITIDTPHLGSQLAPLLLSPGEEVGCVEDLLSLDGKFVFNTVELAGFSQPISGAMQDLTPGSQALSSVANSNSHQLPTALIAGVYTQFASLSPTNSFIGGVCSLAQDPLARDLTPTGWPAIFNGENNDAIVSVTSQLNGLISPLVFQNRVHSPGTEHLGFSPPSVLDPDSLSGVPSAVISLLNTPVNFTSSTSTPFVFINP